MTLKEIEKKKCKMSYSHLWQRTFHKYGKTAWKRRTVCMFCTYTHALHTTECKHKCSTHTSTQCAHDVHKYISVRLLCAGVRKSGTPVFPIKRYSVAHPTKWESNLTNRMRRRRERKKKQTWIENDGTCDTANENWTGRKAKWMCAPIWTTPQHRP